MSQTPKCAASGVVCETAAAQCGLHGGAAGGGCAPACPGPQGVQSNSVTESGTAEPFRFPKPPGTGCDLDLRCPRRLQAGPPYLRAARSFQRIIQKPLRVARATMGILQQQRPLLQSHHNPCGTQAPARPGAPRRSLSHVQGGSAGLGAASAALGARRGPLRVGPPRRLRGPTPTEAHSDVPPAQGLFNPENDQDSCGWWLSRGPSGAVRAALTTCRHSPNPDLRARKPAPPPAIALHHTGERASPGWRPGSKRRRGRRRRRRPAARGAPPLRPGCAKPRRTWLHRSLAWGGCVLKNPLPPGHTPPHAAAIPANSYLRAPESILPQAWALSASCPSSRPAAASPTPSRCWSA
jgi:hypothetical protein